MATHTGIYAWCTVMVVALATGAQAAVAEENPVWKSSKYGIMITHGWGGPGYDLTRNPDLSVPKSIDEVAEAFDVRKFVADLTSFNPEYVVFAAWHARMNPLFPCAAMDTWRGKGHAARRDVLGEVIQALKPTGIKFFLYVHPSDGHDMSQEDQAALGWNESTLTPPERWAPGKFVKWNDFMNAVFDELGAKYGKDVLGYWVDGGWNKVDRIRLQETIRKHNAKAEFFSGMDMGGWCRKFNQLCPPDPRKGIPAATPQNADTWPCFGANVNLLQGGCWWTTGGWGRVSPENMLRYTVLEAGCNTSGGGVGWAADCYTDGTWEPMVREYLAIMGQLIKPIEESVKNTLPSTSYITPQGSRIATLPHGIVATRSADGRYEYIHVLNAPTVAEDAYRQKYVSVLQLPPPADFKKFNRAVMLRSGREATLTQDAKGVRISVRQDAWDPIDTVVKLTVQPGFGLLSRGKALTMSGPEIADGPLKNAVDGNLSTGWRSEPVKEGERPWVVVDLGAMVTVAGLQLYPLIQGNTVGHNFPVGFEVAVSPDGKAFTPVLSVADYKVRSVRGGETDYVWDPDLNDYRKAKTGEATGDLSLSGSGSKNSADYSQPFFLPDGTKGRYVKITGTKLQGDSSMQFTEIEVFGSK